jgi:hypothetical protein
LCYHIGASLCKLQSLEVIHKSSFLRPHGCQTGFVGSQAFLLLVFFNWNISQLLVQLDDPSGQVGRSNKERKSAHYKGFGSFEVRCMGTGSPRRNAIQLERWTPFCSGQIEGGLVRICTRRETIPWIRFYNIEYYFMLSKFSRLIFLNFRRSSATQMVLLPAQLPRLRLLLCEASFLRSCRPTTSPRCPSSYFST